MKLIVGLGNPENKYDNTRHNIGFMCLNDFAKQNHLEFKKKFNGYSTEFIFNNEKIILLKPDTFMNNSGEAIRKYMDYFSIDKKDILVVYDDLDLEFSTIRIKYNSSSGGHNGIKSIINHLNSQEFTKLKIGIKNEYKKDTKNFVLDSFNKTEKSSLVDIYNEINIIIEAFIKNSDHLVLMNKYN